MWTNSYPLRVGLSSTAFSALEPISSPTTLFFFLPSIVCPLGRCSTSKRFRAGDRSSRATNTPSKIASKGQRQFGDEERIARLLRGGRLRGQQSRSRDQSLQTLKYQMILC